MRTHHQGVSRSTVVVALLITAGLGHLAGCSDASVSGNGVRADGSGLAGLADGLVFGGSDGISAGVTDGQIVDVATADAGGNVRGACDFSEAPASGQPGASCKEPSDCDSGYCVEGPDGRVCTRKCVECCPQGFACQESKLGDAEFVCMPRLAALCRPCITDQECGALNPGALCVGYGGDGAFCGGTCSAAKDCPVGYACEDAKGSQGEAKQCVRKVGLCGCSPRSISDGAATTCSTTNGLGTCAGKRTCVTSGLGPCDAVAAAAELCNSVDDDCDGETDENAGGAACQISNGVGSCPGTTACEAGKEVCKGLDPQLEQCNGQDDDCDGATDEGFPDTDKDGKADCLDDDKDGDNYPDAKDCDPSDPAINPGATEVCNGKDDDCDGLTDEKDAKGCTTFYSDVDGDQYGDPAKSACLCQPDAVFKVTDGNDCNDLSQAIFPGAKEVCNGADDNCDKSVDEGFQLGGACDAGQGKCKVYGKMICAANGASTTCSATAAAAGAEICDGADNDCDGQTDEGFQVGGPCTAGLGACKVSGTWKCSANGSQAVCDAVVPGGKTEVCDGVDNNCDGQVDEGCDSDKDGYCNKNMTVLNNAACSKGQGDCDDSRNDVYPGHTELCDNRDNNCDGTIDNFTADCSNGCGKGAKTCNGGSWSSCSAPTPKCTSGACCDGCNYRSSATKCGTSAYKTAYQCSGTCGGQVRRYDSYQYCTGSSASCGTSNLKQVYAGVTKTCSSGQLCSQSGSSASCTTCATGCVSGKCNVQPIYTICIDPQFGGSSVGATWNGVSTKDLNLDIALKLKSLLTSDTSNGNGGGTWKVVMTRSNDSDPSIPSRISICNNAGSHRLLSIAVNAYTSSAAKGIESYYYKSSSQSFCSLMHNEVLARTGFYNRGLKTSSGYSIIKNVNTSAACMSAPGFISNTADVAKLKSSSFRTEIARAMMYAIQKSFGYGAFNP